nr:hypothetical protein [Tanacetum cinerariifolium]
PHPPPPALVAAPPATSPTPSFTWTWGSAYDDDSGGLGETTEGLN